MRFAESSNNNGSRRHFLCFRRKKRRKTQKQTHHFVTLPKLSHCINIALAGREMTSFRCQIWKREEKKTFQARLHNFQIDLVPSLLFEYRISRISLSLWTPVEYSPPSIEMQIPFKLFSRAIKERLSIFRCRSFSEREFVLQVISIYTPLEFKSVSAAL